MDGHLREAGYGLGLEIRSVLMWQTCVIEIIRCGTPYIVGIKPDLSVSFVLVRELPYLS